MAVTLTIEDGSVVPNANSFVSLAEARAYATQRGIATLPADDDQLSSLLISACDYVQTYEGRMQGSRFDPINQSLCYPRNCVWLFDVELATNVIPLQLKTAQIQVAIAASTGIELFPSQTEANVIRETVGPLTTEYQANSWNASDMPIFSNVEATIKPLLNGSTGSFWQTVRV